MDAVTNTIEHDKIQLRMFVLEQFIKTSDYDTPKDIESTLKWCDEMYAWITR